MLVALALGAFLVGAAKQAALPSKATVLVNVNTATAAQIARVLQLPAAVGERIVAARARRGRFADVDALGRLPLAPDPEEAARRLNGAGLTPRTATRQQIADTLGDGMDRPALDRLLALRDANENAPWLRLLSAPLVAPVRMRAGEPQMIARTWDEAGRQFTLSCGLLAGFLVLGHLILRRTRPRSDPFLFPIAGLLSVLGVLMLFSLKDPLRDMPSYGAQTQGVVFGGGVALLLALSRPFDRLPLHRYGYVYAVAALLGTLLLGALGSGPAGVRLSVFGTQPVEAIKILLVFFLAAYLAERGPLLNDPLRKIGPFPLPRRKDAAPLLVLYALPLLLFAIVRDLGPVLLLFGTFLLLVYLATGRGVYVALGLLALAAGGVFGYQMRFGVFETRVDMWRSPWNNGHVGGDHLALGLWGLASGGPMGTGLGLGAPRFIPRGGSDLAFASLGEEMGLAGALLVVACFGVIAQRGLRIALRAQTDFERLLASGLSGLLALQAVIIFCGTLGLLPLTGITLPFVSYGKSSLVASFFMVGVLLLLSARQGGGAFEGRSGGGAAATVTAPRLFAVGAARVALILVLLLAVLVPARLVWVHVLNANGIAGRMVRVPDADGVKRDHVNPRLLALAARIPRGRILDRAGRVLAETNQSGRRVYPFGAATGHLVGYLSPAVGGPAGLEKRYDARLRGFPDARAEKNKPVHPDWSSLVPLWRRKDLPLARLPKGEDVVTSLDAGLQQAALAALRAGAAGVRDRRSGRPKNRGAVVVIDVETGGVLAAATSPTYDPNTLTPRTFRTLQANLNNESALLNRAVSGAYPPGSTFKIVTASGLFATGQADFTFTCAHVDTDVIWRAGGTTYARRRIVDDETENPHGLVNLTEAVSESCNIYFAHAGLAVGPQPLREHASQFGFARLPPIAQFGAELPDVAFGQGPMLASPLEMAGVAATVASGGRHLRPQFLKDAKPAVTATPLSPSDAGRLQEMMRRVTVSGTAGGRFADLPYPVAGKTGTAQNEEGDRMSHSWFIGFAPADRPKVAFAVIVENGGYGASVAVPIARQVLRAAEL